MTSPKDTLILLNLIQKWGSTGKNNMMSMCQEEMSVYWMVGEWLSFLCSTLAGMNLSLPWTSFCFSCQNAGLYYKTYTVEQSYGILYGLWWVSSLKQRNLILKQTSWYLEMSVFKTQSLCLLSTLLPSDHDNFGNWNMCKSTLLSLSLWTDILLRSMEK